MENIELAQERKRSEVPLVTVGSDIFINADPSDPKRVNGVHVWCLCCDATKKYPADSIFDLTRQIPTKSLTHCPDCGAKIIRPLSKTAPLS
jgi:hypothetical protein